MGPCTTTEPKKSVGRWTYLATAMEEWLKDAAKRRYVSPRDIPKAVFAGAREFIEIVREADRVMRRGTFPPQGWSAVAHGAAQDAFVGMSRESRQDWLKYAAQFLLGATRAHRLTREEASIACTLARFFGRIRQKGEAERYAQAMTADDDE